MMYDQLRIMLSSQDDELVRQALELMIQLEGLDEIEQISTDLIKPDPVLQASLKVNWQLRRFLGRSISRHLQQAVLYVLLKVTGEWESQKALYLTEYNEELDRIEMYDDLNQIEDLWISADLLQSIGALPSLKNITIFGFVKEWSWLDRAPHLQTLNPCMMTLGAFRNLPYTLDHIRRLEHLSASFEDPFSSPRFNEDTLSDLDIKPSLKKRVVQLGLRYNQKMSHQINDVRFSMRLIPDSSTLSSFLMMETPVTQIMYKAITNQNPSQFKGDHHPVETVSLAECIRFCNQLSKALNLVPCYPTLQTFNPQANGFRLPWSSEWLWAAQGGETFSFAGSPHLDEVGWYARNSNRTTHPVGQKKSNAYGLFDLSGNVSEWCIEKHNDPFTIWEGVIRGGSWCVGEQKCKLTYFDRPRRARRLDRVGFRIIQNLN